MNSVYILFSTRFFSFVAKWQAPMGSAVPGRNALFPLSHLQVTDYKGGGPHPLEGQGLTGEKSEEAFLA